MGALLDAGKALLGGSLSVGAQGSTVTLLHTCLLLLRSAADQAKSPDDHKFTVPFLDRSEVAEAAFGPSTRLVVLAFQQQHKNLLARAPSGVVERDTATVLFAKLAEAGVDLDKPKNLFVAGRITFADGSSSSSLTVQVTDRDLRTEKQLLVLTVGADGYFAGQYSCNSYLRSGVRRPTLVTRVRLGKELLYTTTVDDAIYDAPALALIKVQLTQRSPTVFTPDQFTQIVAALAVAVPPVDNKQSRVAARHVSASQRRARGDDGDDADESDQQEPEEEDEEEREQEGQDDEKEAEGGDEDDEDDDDSASEGVAGPSQRVSQALDSHALVGLPLPDIASRIRSLREDDKVQDVSFLTRLNPSTLTTEKLTTTILAYRVANVAQSKHRLNVPAEVFYGLLASGITETFSSSDPSNAATTQPSLQTSPESLLYQFGLMDPTVISKALADAQSRGLVSSNVTKIDVTRIWQQLGRIAHDWIILQPSVEDNVWAMIADFLSTGKEEAVRSVLNGENIEGDLGDFLKRLLLAFSSGATSAAGPPPSLTATGAGVQSIPALSPPAMLDKVQETTGQSKSQLAALSHTKLRALVSQVRVGSGAKVTGEEAHDAATGILGELEREFPMEAFKMNLREHVGARSGSSQPQHGLASPSHGQPGRAGAASSSEESLLGHPSLEVGAGHVLTFLEQNPDFDLLSGTIELSGAPPEQGSRAAASVAVVQRVFKLTPTFAKTLALLDMGVGSATDVARRNREQFVRLSSSPSSTTPSSSSSRSLGTTRAREDEPRSPQPALTADEAAEVFDRATNIRLATALLAGNIRTASNALLAAGISEPLPPAKLDAVTKQFPSIASLFEMGDVCACTDCMTVYSPSAYLVDALEFLRARGVLDSPGGPDNGKTARDILLGRRPDLGDLDLSCDNTNVTLPYIDLVCELLEDYVAPDGLSPGSFTGSVSKGTISDALLKFLHTDLALPFTSEALVSDVYGGGFLTVRDKGFVVSLSPGAQKVKVLRQTYGSAAALAASPAYINAEAYKRLSTARYLPSLPFDAVLEESRGYLRQLGVARPDLMRTLSYNTPDYNLALEAFGLSFEDGRLITTEDAGHQDAYWNTGNATNPAKVLKRVDRFIDAARIEYTELQEMLTRATAWLNRPASPPQGSGKTAVGDIFIRHNDSSCTLAAKDIIGLEAAGSPGAAPGFFALDRFHRFLRLWRALTANSPSGWDIASIDRVIGARLLGGGHLNTTCIEIISAVDRLAPALSSQKPTTVHDVINLYAGLLPSTPAGASPTLVTYTSVYLNQTANGPVHPAFELPAIARNDSATPPVPVPKLSDAAFVDYISICLNISAPDTKLIIQSLLSQQPSDDVLSVASLSRVYAVASISSRLGLTVPDYFLLAKLSGLAPLEHVAQLADLQEVTAKLGALGLSIPDLELLLVPPPTPRLAGDIAVERITAILTGIQSQYADIQKANTSPVNPDVPAGENASAVLDLVSKVPGTIQTDISRFKQMLGGSLDAAEGAPFLQKIFGSFLSGDAVTAIAEAQAALAAAPGDESRKAALTNVVAGQLSAAFAAQQRAKALGGALASGLALPTDVLAALQEDIPALATLLDAALASGSVSDISFPKQYRAIRLLYRVWVALGHFNLPVASVSWLLQNAQKLGWASLASLPTDVGDSPVSWAAWQALVDYVQLVHSGAFTPVRNPADKNSRFTLESFLSLSLAVPAPGADQLAGYFASLTSYRVDIIRALITHLHLTPDSLKAVETMTRLQSAASVIRQLGMSTAAAISLAEAEAPSRDDMVAARRALKLRYAVDSDWYGVLKGVQDPLRLSKRDALVAFLLAVNKPRITSARDLSELLLLDVQMGTVTLTSRIIQAHQSLQQFVQRLLMGLEPTPVVEGDASWAHWAEMSQYRLWEANKKVFLYPENWIEPALRDNKSELYRNLEADLKKQPLTDASTESAIAGYLGGLDHIADLEVMSCFYDTATTTLHVFARTKGGSPREYYHRTMVLEAEWTPWEHLQDVNPAGNHLVTFFRRNRLTVSWPVFSYEQDPAQASQPPAYPDPDNMAGEKPDPVRKRLLVQLAVCERNPDTGKWSQPVVTEKGVYWPGPLSSDKYADATAFPPNLEAAISLHFWDLGLKLGELIVVRVTGRGREINSTALFGVFTLTGCKGYPEPFLDDSSGFAWRFTALPAFKETDFLTQRFIKTHLLSNSAPLDLAIMAMPSPQLASILGREYGRFVVTYPTQPTIVDRALIGLQMFSVASTPKTGTHLEMVSSKIRAWFVPEGTFLPYFVSDSSTRGYAVIPGYESAVKGDVNFRTASATLNFFNDAVRLALKYIDIYFNELNKDARALRTRLNRDEKYLELKREFLAVYANAPTPWDVTLRTPRANLVNFYHPLVCFLRGQLYAGGTGLLMARSTQLRINKDFDFNVAYQPTPHVRAPLPREELDFANRAAYSIYNWELFFHLPFQIAAGLSADKQYEQARKWYHYIFNPQGADMEDPDTGADKAKAPQKKYWQTKPFFKTQVADYQAALIDKILGAVAGDPTGASLANELKNQILLWRRNPYSPHVIARSRPVAYQLSVVIKYIQNLVDWGDGLFRQLTREALTQALTLYGVADRLLGAKPRVVEPAVRVPARTYNELGRSVDLLGNALLSLENLVPDLGKLPHGGRELPQPPNPPLTSLYFGIPPNSSMLQLWDTVADRLYKIRHSQDIDGNFVSLSLTAPPIDPGALIKALASGQSLSDVIGQLGAPLPHYRFAYLHERAQVMTSHVVELGSQLLSMLQRRDDEGLARLRANSEPKVLAAVRETKAAAVTQNKSAVKALEASRALAEERNTYYQQQLKNAINKVELDGLLANIDAMAVDGAMASGYGAASSWSLVPVLSVGVSGFGGSPQVSASWGGSNMASKLGNDMSAAATTRSSLGTEAQLAATVAAYVRRIEDWTFQQKLAEHEMAQVDQQIVAAKDQGIVLDKELAAHDVQTTEATATATYLAGKFTNTELFDWAAGRVAATYTRAYNLAFSMAKKAERCMAFELGDFSGAASGIIQYGQYDNLRSGLLAGGDLLADLDRLAATYADRHARELELTKHVSLAQLDPDALLRLRSTGSCIFALPEWLFDLDYPGHYFRRTRSLSLSIPCVVGPYTTVAATLRLLSSRFRARPTRTRPASAYPESPPGGDDRFVYDVAPPAVATATSSAVNDAGVFDLRLDGSSDPRYLPFENAGTLGTYALDLSPTHQFPYSAVADVVLTVNYTARDGGSTVRDAAKPAPTSGTAAIPFRTAFPTEWATLRGAGREVQPVLVAPPPSSTGSSTGGTGGWTLPHWATAQGRTPVVQQTVWCAVPDPATASLDGLILVVAGQELTLAKDTAGGNYWKATLAAKKVVLGQAVSVAWGDPADRNKVAEIICVVGWNYSTA